MPSDKRESVQKGQTQQILDWGMSHKPSASIWKTMTDARYIQRMNRALDLFDIPKNIEIAADIGCGPWSGIFYIRKWNTMYAIDPSWDIYDNLNLVKVSSESVQVIEEYAQDFKLPEKSQIMFSINSLNHGGDITKSIANCMLNLCDNGLFFLHLHLRNKTEVDKGHPIDLDDDQAMSIINQHKVVSSHIYDFDPLKAPGGHRTIVATLLKE